MVDIVLLLILLGFVGAGAKDGFVHTLGRFVGAIIGFVIARSWSLKLLPFFDIFMPAGWARLIAFVIIFIFINRLVGYGFKLIDGAFKILSILPFLKSINSLLGGVLGFFEGIVVLGGAIYLIVTFTLEPTLAMWLKASAVTPWVQRVFQTLLGILL